MVCGVGVHCGSWELAPNGCRWGFWMTGGPKRERGMGPRESQTNKASPTSWTHPHSFPRPPHTRNDRKAVVPSFCFMFQILPVVVACFKIALSGLCLRL